MTTALAIRNQRDPVHASARLRKAAEHYVRGGCKAIGPSLRWAGFAARTAKEPTKNGYTHDRLVQVAAYWNQGAQETARSHLATAVATLAGIMTNPLENAQARGSAAKIILDVGKKEEEKEDISQTRVDEQAKWMALIRHWKRTFLRRGLVLGMAYRTDNPAHERTLKLLESLNYELGKGPRPAWMEDETDGESEGLLGPEGDLRPDEDGGDEILEGEIVTEAEAEAGPDPTGAQ